VVVVGLAVAAATARVRAGEGGEETGVGEGEADPGGVNRKERKEHKEKTEKKNFSRSLSAFSAFFAVAHFANRAGSTSGGLVEVGEAPGGEGLPAPVGGADVGGLAGARDSQLDGRVSPLAWGQRLAAQ